MSKHLDIAKEERTNGPANCCQAVILAYADEIGLSREQAMKLGSNFGAGMKCGSVCGAITGGLMVTGMLGKDGNEFRKAMKDSHGGFIDCKDLLKASAEKGEDKKTHCDGLIFDAVKLIED
ncbi:C_GCAxxG_C_C family probable redox protein [Acetitomaculum ruminis DSM 5522]|uniref:C_GCAxxG_C_C family probable redox protein n=1 Tax=Acetitomaculum ruminis DSM 5522 TaxID=1120918 RepID=A0A1I0W138_9FIRM|nr:C-GCAxxG-C-C family protein [Acetitomaculum ruminis]SFA82465.1 C_GCAxxG_C_C family probable redox protein [Acetitomaculum ruminis DSM 5522]